MLGLLESKLNSLPPEITNGYPELVHISLNDVKPEIVKINPTVNNAINAPNAKGAENNRNPSFEGHAGNSSAEVAEAQKDKNKDVNKEPTAQEKLEKFIEENEDITTYCNMLKYK